MSLAGVTWSAQAEQWAKLCALDIFYPGAEHDDVLQEARLGVAKGLRDYRPEAGASLRNFAMLCGHRQVLTGLRLAQREYNRVLTDARSLQAPAPGSLDVDMELGDILPAPQPDPDAPAEVARLVRHIKEQLSPLERECLVRCTINGEPYDALPHAQRRVDNAIQRARRKLRAAEAPRRWPEAMAA